MWRVFSWLSHMAVILSPLINAQDGRETSKVNCEARIGANANLMPDAAAAFQSIVPCR
jgi:hypothetical protein